MTLLIHQNKIQNVTAFIHVPAPPTPLCINPSQPLNTDLVTEEIIKDVARAITVTERAQFLRDYLKYGGILYAAYPTNGLLARTEEQQKIFKNEVQKNCKNLFTIELEMETFPREMCGATYFFTLEDKTKMVFSIKSYQANDTEGTRQWGLWLGPTDVRTIEDRANEITNFINCSNKNFRIIRI